MEMAYRERWKAEIAEMRGLLSSFDLTEERKWGKPTYTLGGKNIVILQGFKEYFALGFFQGALLKDQKNLLVQLGRTQAARVMKFTSVAQIVAQKKTIKAYVSEAIALAEAGARVDTTSPNLPVPDELKAAFRADPALKKAFSALTPGRQRSWLYHFTDAKQPATRARRIEKATPAIFSGNGFLERPKRR
ncbi:MAG TPA: YdeI/OmpD-associated family protein [Candidatus Aquilonibacter sp.]|nr:YdeI/OmpD-associated family protein [Candidatus Aquilonibacter sp.]